MKWMISAALLVAIGHQTAGAVEQSAEAASDEAREKFAEQRRPGAAHADDADVPVETAAVTRTRDMSTVPPTDACASKLGNAPCSPSRKTEPPPPPSNSEISTGRIEIGEAAKRVAVLGGGYLIGGPPAVGILGLIMLFGW
jgi:hypothetical protein